MAEEIKGGDDGKEVKQEPQTIEMRIVAEPNQPIKVHFPFLIDKVATYGFLKVAEKVLDAHYAQQQPKVIPVKGGMLNFARRLK